MGIVKRIVTVIGIVIGTGIVMGKEEIEIVMAKIENDEVEEESLENLEIEVGKKNVQKTGTVKRKRKKRKIKIVIKTEKKTKTEIKTGIEIEVRKRIRKGRKKKKKIMKKKVQTKMKN